MSVLADKAYLSLSQMLAIVGAAESGSEHPLGSAVVKFVTDAFAIEGITGASLAGFRTVPGQSLSRQG